MKEETRVMHLIYYLEALLKVPSEMYVTKEIRRTIEAINKELEISIN